MIGNPKGRKNTLPAKPKEDPIHLRGNIDKQKSLNSLLQDSGPSGLARSQSNVELRDVEPLDRSLQASKSRQRSAACHPKLQNARFTTAACNNMYETSAGNPRYLAAYKNHRFTTVSDVRPARSAKKGCPSTQKFAFHHRFWTPDEHEVTRGLREDPENLHFTTVSGVRRSLFA